MDELTKVGTTTYHIQVLQHGKWWENTYHPDFSEITEATAYFDEKKKHNSIPMRIVQTRSAVVHSWEPEKE